MAGAAEVLVSVVLVHGGFVDGSGWDQVYSILKKDGYSVSGRSFGTALLIPL